MSLPCRNSYTADQMGCRSAAAKPKAATPWMTDPFALFDAWFAEARATEPNDPEAMALATADADGPAVGANGASEGRMARTASCFYTNLDSRKGDRACRQPARRARCSTGSRCAARSASKGRVERVSDAEADAYFASRSRAIRSSAPGRRTSRARSTAARPSSSASRKCERASTARTCRGRRTGRASG